MYYPDDDTLVIDRQDVEDTETDDDDSSSQTSSGGKRYKGFCYGRLNPDLLLCKVFYLTFYGSYGSLYPLIAVYFKQLGLSATQSGILVGIRPFVEFCAAPMWGAVADTWRKAKWILLFSLLSWFVFTELVAFVQPAQKSCVEFNISESANTTILVLDDKLTVAGQNSIDLQVKKPQPANSSLAVRSESSSDVENEGSGSPEGKTVIFKYKSVNNEAQFVLLLLLMILGEFFSSPTITLADSATLGYLGSNRMEMYGRQRMFGSLAWGVLMFIEGLILEKSRVITVECDGQVTEEKENYLICFGTYAVLITCAFFVATQFQFKYNAPLSKTVNRKRVHGKSASESVPLQPVRKEPHKYTNDVEDEPSPQNDRRAEAEDEETNYWEVLSMYASIRYGTVLYVVWFAGFGFGFLFTFLYWHLKDMGGPPTLFGVASIVNHMSEVTGYFFSGWFINNLGHIPVLCLGLMCFAVRFIVISVIGNPWLVLTVETLQGLTHALVWAASTSFIGAVTSQRNRSSAQGILQGVYHGLGRGCGAIFGGLIINAYGSTAAFRAIGISYIIVVLIFAFIQYMESGDGKSEADSKSDKQSDGSEKVIQDTDLSYRGEATARDESDSWDERVDSGGDRVGGGVVNVVSEGGAIVGTHADSLADINSQENDVTADVTKTDDRTN